jgi:hypothetical protein
VDLRKNGMAFWGSLNLKENWKQLKTTNITYCS